MALPRGPRAPVGLLSRPMSASEHRPGDFPEVHDEAPDTPTWVPILGIGLLALFALFAVYRAATAPEQTADVDVVIEAQPAEGGEQAPAEEPAADEPTPAPSPH